ncbi:hypothetical protein GCK32_011694 [Trichostrongylus colubriformis]|uniref:CCHC-type domain-containing protein n=1 Tax=Trichostrongylus colubriformis TaxID=6319 RepID=A0AAN8F8Y4_TRICO
MSTVATFKANLTKAITAWETVRGKIPASVLQPIAAPADVIRVELEERQATIEAHLSQVRVALRTLADRRQALLNVFRSSSAQDEDVDACDSYDQKDRVDAAVAAAESIATSLSSRLDETKELVKIKYPSSLSDTSDHNVGAQQQPQQQPGVTIVGDNVHQVPTTPVDHNTRPHVLPQRPTDAPNFFSHNMPQYLPAIGGPPYASTMPPVQLGKLTLEPFTRDITQFHRFWCTFELAVHNNPYTPPVYKFLYLQNLLKGEAQVVLQDLDPDECNYDQLVAALKRRYEDFSTVLPLLDLVKSKFPQDIQQKLHDLEFQTNSDFDLNQVMSKLDLIISSKEKYEDSTTLCDSLAVSSAIRERDSSRSPSTSRYSSSSARCCFCDAVDHRSTRCPLDVPVVVRRTLVRTRELCWKCLREGHRSSSCNCPPCRTCRKDHHELLRSEREYTRRQSRKDRRSDERHRHRSPYRHQSRSPPREHRRDRDSSRSDRSQSQSRSRYQSRRDSHSSYSSRSQSPQRVKFHSPVRDHSGSHKRRSSPYPQQNQVLESDDEANTLFSCYTSVSSNNSVSPPRTPASLMLVKGKALNHMSSAMEQVVLFLDSGAQKSFIASNTAHRLGLSIRDSHPRTFITFGGHPTTEVSGTAQLTLIDLLGEQFTLELTTKQTITLPQYPPRLSFEDVEFIQNHGLPLPLCSSKSVVPDILIGIDHYWDILSSESPICLPSGMGPYAADIVAVSQHDDDSAIKRLWSLDLIGVADDYDVSVDSKLESRIIQEFNDTSQFVNGVLYVRFPWKPDHPRLEDNKQLAYCRLMNQFKRLNQTPVAWQQYVKVIEDHITAGSVEEKEEYVFDDPRVYYIPHQAVCKESSATTKLRVVFDASSKRKGARSLNDCIYQGPTLVPELVGILLRARLHPFWLIADAEKAFHQIRLQRSQQDATRSLWLKDTSKPLSADNLRIIRFTRIPFGVNASPFLLAAAIKLYIHREQCPVGAEISRNTYVDNVILGASSRSEAPKKYELAKSIFTRMHMNLREFLSNSTYVNSRIASRDRAIDPSSASVLGIRWDFENDTLTIRLKTACAQVNTKRSALRALAATYDPMGLLTPFLVPAKVIRITAYVLKCLRRYVFERVSETTQHKTASKLPSVASVTSSSAIQASDIDFAEVQLILAHYRESEKFLQHFDFAKYHAQRAKNQLIRCPSRIVAALVVAIRPHFRRFSSSRTLVQGDARNPGPVLWYVDYLNALRERHQNRIRQGKYSISTPQLGDIVIVADDKLARGQWPYGLIEKLHFSKDNCARSADVRMPNGKINSLADAAVSVRNLCLAKFPYKRDTHQDCT